MYSAHREVILAFDAVNFSYHDGGQFIRDMNIAIEDGEFVGLLGANGSGKSTLLKLACGILKPLRGGINLWNKPLNLYRHKDRAKLISYLPQILDINVPFTVKEVVSMGLYPYDTPPPITVDDAIEMVGLVDKAEEQIINLSGGERRRTYLAMTLLQGAGILLLDEPLANLDIKYQIEFIRLLRELQKKRGITIVMALHDINIALQFEKIMLLKEGKILGIGNPDKVLTRDLLKEAFDVDVEVRRQDGGAYIKY